MAKEGKSKVGQIVGRTCFVIVWTLLLIVLILVGVIWVMEKGPSPTATNLFARSVRETSAIKWIADIFLSDEEVAALNSTDEKAAETEAVNVSLIHVASAEQASTAQTSEGEQNQQPDDVPNVEVIEIKGSTYKGKLMIVHDPKSVIVGTSDNFGSAPGLQLTDMVAKYNAVAGINAGGFNDESGTGDGGTPMGMVISNGEITWGSTDEAYSVIGLDANGILIVGKMTGQEALDAGVIWGVSFSMEGAINGALVVNGEVQEYNLASGVNPRTALGQRSDGALLLLVLDGRQIDTLGATLKDVCDVMLEYGAVNVGNLDGGSSSVMVYDGQIINSCASVTGPRRIPTSFVVLGEGQYE